MSDTIAERAAAAVGDDGQRWTTQSGERVEDVWRRAGAVEEKDRSGEHDNGSRFVFSDGSAIVTQGAAWDVEGSAPWSWQGAE